MWKRDGDSRFKLPQHLTFKEATPKQALSKRRAVRRQSLKIITPFSPLSPTKQALTKKPLRRHQTYLIQPKEVNLNDYPDRPDTTSPLDVFCDSRLSFPSSSTAYIERLFEDIMEEDLLHKNQLREVKDCLDDYIQELQGKLQGSEDTQTEIQSLTAENQLLRDQIAQLTKSY